MSLILSLETSTDVCSVALHQQGKLVAAKEVHEAQAHASRLAPLIDEILAASRTPMTVLQAVAISSGPGSYTGLRIGTSTAKGICYALNIPLITVSTLALMARQAIDKESEDALFCPMIDARRMEVYCEVYTRDLNILQPVEAKVIDDSSFQELLQAHRVFFFGNGAAKCKSVIKHTNALFTDDVYPQASMLGVMAHQRFVEKQFADLMNFAPFYLKEFVAKKSQALL